MDHIKFKYCVWCFKDISKVGFSREHIIPSSIGGLIYSDHILCTKCNNDFGTEIDSNALKHREIIELAHEFGLISDTSKYLTKSHDINIEAEGNTIKGYLKNGKVYPIPQQVSDDHIIVPDDITKETITKLVKRDNRLKHLSDSEKENEIEILLKKYAEIAHGNFIHSKKLGLLLKKGITGDKINFRSKSVNDPLVPLVLKIFYEWLSIIAYDDFFRSEKIFPALRESILSKEAKSGISVIRLEEKRDKRSFHCVIIEFDANSTICLISLFSKITYQVFAPPLELSFLDFHRKANKLDSLCGIHIEENFHDSKKTILFIDDSGKRINSNIEAN
ncbi:MAG: HNH endonuclease [Balneolaceae bacterium]|nr:HNH endonuclease [Balneolaceae bacterium]